MANGGHGLRCRYPSRAMNPIWRDRIVTAVASVLAVWFAYKLADGDMMLPMGVAAFTAAAILVRLAGQTIDAIAVGVLLVGFMVGNRGFAQLMPVPGLPLLPAEAGLGIAGACLVWRCARDKTLPWRRSALDAVLLAWILVGTARFAYDLPRFGFVAIRDFAMVYYVAFFFISRQLCQHAPTQRFLLGSFLFASAMLPFVLALFELFPDFFLSTLLVRGVPLIFFKGDLATMFLGTGGICLYLMAPPRYRWGARPLAIGMILWVFTSDGRASMLGVLVALGWVALSRFRRFAWLQVGLLALAFLLLAGFATFTENKWAATKLGSITERAITVVDFEGRFHYRQAHSFNKSDNNQFRWVWWRTVAAETMAVNPPFGLGFGYDLARGFLQTYNPDMADDFTARSPHNIFMTALGRMGLVGLALLAWLYGILVVRTWRIVRNPASDATQVALWVALWPIAISACLGVVLEGPMGAVVFWSLLGLANAYRSAPEPIASEVEPTPTKEPVLGSAP